MVPIGHPAPHNIHGSHSMQPMPSATPSGPNTLSSNQSNKAASTIVSHKLFTIDEYNSIAAKENTLF